VLIDVHVHYPHGLFDPPGDTRSVDEKIEQLIATERELGARRICINSLAWPPCHDEVAALIRRYPDFVVGFGYIQLGIDPPEQVDRLYGQGFRGLKMIQPLDNYDSKDYYPIYARAEAYRLPILFHTGQQMRVAGRGERGWDVSTARMMPWMLDPIARAFPDLPIIGAHLGVPSFAEAAWVARWNANVFFDLSGSITIRRGNRQIVHDMIYQALAGSGAIGQIVFGSDVTNAEIPDVVAAYGAMLDRLGGDDAMRQQVMYGNMARILGLGDSVG
jgi:uncharacterized protein